MLLFMCINLRSQNYAGKILQNTLRKECILIRSCQVVYVQKTKYVVNEFLPSKNKGTGSFINAGFSVYQN